MNPTDSSSQPLELQPWLWVALGAVAIIGVAARFRDRDELRTLDPFDGDQQIVVRTTASKHAFPILGIQVTLPDGWSYLSVTDDAIADEPTFVNEIAASIVGIRPFRFRAWPPIEAKIEKRQYDNFTIEWVEMDHRRIGRFTQGDVDISLWVLTHTHKSRLNDAVDDLCHSIVLIGEGD